MSLKRWAAKRDGNEPEIVLALRKAGALVQPLSERGVPDLLVSYRGRLHLLEVKAPRGSLTPDQEDFLARWDMVRVVETPLEALDAIGAI